jgi:hypothetical protein
MATGDPFHVLWLIENVGFNWTWPILFSIKSIELQGTQLILGSYKVVNPIWEVEGDTN